MPYWGKVVGVIAGLATGRPWLALVGLLLGHQFDRGYAKYYSQVRKDRDLRQERLPEHFMRPLFQTMGCLAKADGRVSEDEIRAARTMMHRLGLGPAQVRHAIDWFQSGKEPAFPLQETIAKLKRDLSRNSRLRQLFVQLLMEVSLSKGRLRQSERALLWSICRELGISRVDLAQLEAMLRAQHSFRSSPEGAIDARRVKEAYATLGVAQSATNDEIKQAYRRLMNRNHPDKLASSNPEASALATAQKRTRDIRGAYEMLKVRRSIR